MIKILKRFVFKGRVIEVEGETLMVVYWEGERERDRERDLKSVLIPNRGWARLKPASGNTTGVPHMAGDTLAGT